VGGAGAAQLLMLDKPTAALDARADYEVFLRFSELTKGRMAVLDLPPVLDGADGGSDSGAEGWAVSGTGDP
jgi:hypothetical protein